MVRFFSALFRLCVFGLIGILVVGIAVYWYFSKDLPNYRQLAEYRPPVISRVYATDGSLIGEFAKERRLYTPIDNIPLVVRHAFIAAEDQNFYTHPGVDYWGVLRAMVSNVANIGSGKRMQGASTITQQVMKNFLLTHERKFERKVKEAILATRFEETFTKNHILELYLNEIFLGAGTYGVTSAAQTYFGKSLDKLSLEEIAYLAALPKGPNNYHPKRFNERAKFRRNYVLARMADDGYITKEQAETASKKPLISILGENTSTLDASYYVEEVRRNLLTQYGETVLYNAGLTVTASINPVLQRYAEQALRRSLIELDKKLGWRGAIAHNVDTTLAGDSLSKFSTPRDLYDWRVALVQSVSSDGKTAKIYIKEDKKSGTMSFTGMEWAVKSGQPRSIHSVLKQGDVIYVTQNSDKNAYNLCQIPKVNGAFMVMDPHSGRVLAQQGGFTFSQSQFNRATQALRQPGSAFKPFVYAAALERGFTAETLINDGPFFYRDALGRAWQPQNYDKRFLGNVPLRIGIERSRNLMTIRLAQDIGMKNVVSFAKRFGVADKMGAYLPMALGAGETTLEKMVTAYATFANGGKKIKPVYYDRIQDRNGKTIISSDTSVCDNCLEPADMANNKEPEYILDPATNAKMVSLLEGVVKNGTGRTLLSLGIPIAGKTGTTNESKDVWFMGFTSNLVFGTYVGYDNPIPMGKAATGGGTAAPIIKDFLSQAKDMFEFREFSSPAGQYAKYIQKRQNDDSATDTPSQDSDTPTQSPETIIQNIIKQAVPVQQTEPAVSKHTLSVPVQDNNIIDVIKDRPENNVQQPRPQSRTQDDFKPVPVMPDGTIKQQPKLLFQPVTVIPEQPVQKPAPKYVPVPAPVQQNFVPTPVPVQKNNNMIDTGTGGLY